VTVRRHMTHSDGKSSLTGNWNSLKRRRSRRGRASMCRSCPSRSWKAFPCTFRPRVHRWPAPDAVSRGNDRWQSLQVWRRCSRRLFGMTRMTGVANNLRCACWTPIVRKAERDNSFPAWTSPRDQLTLLSLSLSLFLTLAGPSRSVFPRLRWPPWVPRGWPLRLSSGRAFNSRQPVTIARCISQHGSVFTIEGSDSVGN